MNTFPIPNLSFYSTNQSVSSSISSTIPSHEYVSRISVHSIISILTSFLLFTSGSYFYSYTLIALSSHSIHSSYSSISSFLLSLIDSSNAYFHYYIMPPTFSSLSFSSGSLSISVPLSSNLYISILSISLPNSSSHSIYLFHSISIYVVHLFPIVSINPFVSISLFTSVIVLIFHSILLFSFHSLVSSVQIHYLSIVSHCSDVLLHTVSYDYNVLLSSLLFH